MKKIFKSFLKTTFKNWYQTITFLIFIIIAVALTIGFVSNSFQIYTKANNVQLKTNKWDYSFNNYTDNLNDDFAYKFFQNEMNDDLQNPLNKPLLMMDGKLIFNDPIEDVEELTLQQYLNQAFTYQNDFSNQNDFIGYFIKTKIVDYNLTNAKNIELPPIDDNEEVKYFVNSNNILDEEWLDLLSKNISDWSAIINPFLMDLYNKTYDQNISQQQSYRFSYQYLMPNSDINNITYRFETINYNLANNVVSSTLSDQEIANLKNDEIIVTEKFANTYNLKIGDKLKINDFTGYDNNLIHREYTIAGFGIKTTNLFRNSRNSAIVYLTNQEFNNYLEYFWNKDYHVETREGIAKDVITLYISSYFLNNSSTDNLQDFDNFISSKLNAREPLDDIFAYKELNHIQILNSYLIESIIFIFVGFLALLLCLTFINYSIKKELKQMAGQIGIFKALGYKNIELATIVALRTYFLILLGFILGFLVSLPIQNFVYGVMGANLLLLIQPIWFNVWFLLLIFIFTPILLSLLNLLTIFRYLNMNSILMIQMNGSSNFDGKNKFKTNWYTFKFKVKFIPFIHSFSIKGMVKTTTMVGFFTVGFIILTVLFNVKTLMVELTNQNQLLFNPEINHRVFSEKSYEWVYDEQTASYELIDQSVSQEKTIFYEKPEELDELESTNWNETINQYLAINRVEPTVKDRADTLKYILKIFTLNLNHEVLNLNLFNQFLNQFVGDYNDYFKKFFPDLDEIIQKIKSGIVDNLETLSTHLINKNVKLTFNNVFAQNNVDYPLLLRYLPPQDAKKYKNNRQWILSFLNDYNQEVFNLTQYNNLKETSFDKDDKILPIITTRQFSLLNKLKVNDIIDAYLEKRKEEIVPIKFKIVGIEQHLTTSNNIFTLEEYWREIWDNLVEKYNFTTYNIIFSKRTLLQTKDLSLTDLKIDTNFFNYLFLTDKDTFNLLDVFKDTENLINFYNWNSFQSTRYYDFHLAKQAVNEATGNFGSMMNIFIIFSLLIVLLLVSTISAISIVDFKQSIMVLKAFGYKNWEINFKMLKKYILTMVVGLIIAFVITYFFWVYAQSYFFTEFELLINNPFTWIPVIILSSVTLGIILFTWFNSGFIIKKIKDFPES